VERIDVYPAADGDDGGNGEELKEVNPHTHIRIIALILPFILILVRINLT
jgi:hypothetical protein